VTPRNASPIGLRFGSNLQRHRRAEGLSQEAVARRIQIHRTEVGQLERGIRLPQLDTILKLATGVEASPCELMAGLKWLPGHYVEGRFHIADDAEVEIELQ
jgi:transcriptional regulator with XRE-family HTH domain